MKRGFLPGDELAILSKKESVNTEMPQFLGALPGWSQTREAKAYFFLPTWGILIWMAK